MLWVCKVRAMLRFIDVMHECDVRGVGVQHADAVPPLRPVRAAVARARRPPPARPRRRAADRQRARLRLLRPGRALGQPALPQRRRVAQPRLHLHCGTRLPRRRVPHAPHLPPPLPLPAHALAFTPGPRLPARGAGPRAGLAVRGSVAAAAGVGGHGAGGWARAVIVAGPRTPDQPRSLTLWETKVVLAIIAPSHARVSPRLTPHGGHSSQGPARHR
jgi:hypothetical protein